jgi:hypothetical protein
MGLYLKAVFKGGFLSRCLPATAVFAFLSMLLETILWFFVRVIGLEAAVVRYTTWQVLIFQAVLFFLEFTVVRLVGKLHITAGYSDKTMKKMWLPTVGYLVVVSAFWIGLVNFLAQSVSADEFGVTEI